MKAMIILLTGPMMLFFTISAVSTVEWCAEYGGAFPWAWIAGIVIMDVAWCVCAFKCSEEEMNKAIRKYERFIDNIFINKLKTKKYE
jgi:hypothetical protein